MPPTPKKPTSKVAKVSASPKPRKPSRARAEKDPARKRLFDDDDEAFAPPGDATKKLLDYQRRGEKEDLKPWQRSLFAFVERRLPRDFETSHVYGPKSGTSHEERAISAYLVGQLGGDDGGLRRRLKKLVDRKKWGEVVAAVEEAA